MLDQNEIMERLSSLGFEYSSLADLRESGRPYPDAVGVLLESLIQAEGRKLKTEIVRALSVPWAKPDATLPLIHQFTQVEDESGLGLRWTIGNALEVVWDDAYFDALAAIASDRAYGRAREMVVLGLAKSKRDDATMLLVKLLDDPDIGGHAVSALRKRGHREALNAMVTREAIERKLDDDRAWVRRDARAILATFA